jgi:uncharacterized protein (TIGR03435 family)
MKVTVTFLLISPALRPQAQEPKPVFETASIKMTDAKNGGGHSHENSDPGMLRGSMTLKNYIMTAYGVRDFQVIGGPNWIDTSTYEIVAKLENPTDPPPGLASRQRAVAEEDRLHLALQSLLADRFQLKFHHDSKDMPSYVLTVAKSGFKLKPAPETDGCGTNSTGIPNGKKLTATCLGMGRFVTFLSRQMRLPVADETHVQGLYTFHIEWGPDDLNATGPPDDLPSLSVVLERQLGLKLGSKKAPTDIIVVDRAERPSEN